jgi:hypothetical protein
LPHHFSLIGTYTIILNKNRKPGYENHEQFDGSAIDPPLS